MILLDTNVLSEPLRPTPNEQVTAWLDEQSLETLYLSAHTVAEMRAGIALLPSGKKQKKLHDHLENQIFPMFVGRVLAFDFSCTNAYAEILAKTRRMGHAIETVDACIAAIAQSKGLIVATRDSHPFISAGVRVINPWIETY